MINSIFVNCPHCGNINKIEERNPHDGFSPVEFLTCENCEELFYAKVERVVKIEAKGYKSMKDIPKELPPIIKW